MATDPIGGGPVDPNQPSGTPANAGGPPNFNASAMQDSVSAMAASIVEMSKGMESFLGRMASAYEQLAKVRKESEGVSENLKDMANSAEDVTDYFKRARDLQKESHRLTKDEKSTYKEVQAYLQKQVDLRKEMLDSGKLSILQATAVNREMKLLAESLKKAKAEAGPVGDAMKNWRETLQGAAIDADKLARNMGKVAQTHLDRHARSLGEAFKSAGHSARWFGIIEDQLDAARKRRGLKEAMQKHRGETQVEHKRKMEAAAAGAGHVLGMDLPRTPGGRIDWQELKKRPRDEPGIAAARALPKDLVKEVAFRGGEGMLGRLDANLSARAMRSRAAAAVGQQPGVMGKMGIHAADIGGGSVLGGLGEEAMTQAIPAVAIGAAVLKVFESFIDKVAITNQNIEKSMGGALFTPGVAGQTGGEALNTVRQNLRANLFNAYGQNLEKNLGIAKAMQESGLDITELSTGNIRGKRLAGGGQPNVGEGFLGGAFGEFQRNAMVAGRGAGLDNAQSVVRMTRMIQEMRQTFEATHDFFESINVQARAAGVSTTKYLSIIDNLTAQFDKLNKSFNETVSLVQALGASGTSTADKLEDMARSLLGVGESKTLEQKAYSFMAMTPEMKNALQTTQKKLTDQAVGDLQGALQGAGVDMTGMDFTTPQGLMNVQNTIASLPEGTQKQVLKGAADRARYQMNQMNAIVAPGTKGGAQGAVAAVYGQEAYGTGAAAMAATQITNLQRGLALGHTSFQELLKHPDQVGMLSAAVAPTLGVKATDYQSAVESIMSIGSGQVQQARTMVPGADRERQLRHFFEVGKRYGVKGLGEKFDEQAMLKALNDSKIAAGISEGLETDLSKDPAQLLELLAQKIQKGNEAAQDKQVKDVALQTRTVADIYANAFEKFFSMLVDSIMGIKHLLEKIPGLGGGDKVLKETQERLDRMQAKGVFNLAAAQLREESADATLPEDRRAEATTKLAQLQAFQMLRPEERTQDQAKKVLDTLSAYASTASIAQVNPATMATKDWDTLMQRPDISKQALDEQMIRNMSANTMGGQFDDTGTKFWLGQNLQGDQLKALDALSQKVLGTGVGTDTKTGAQYITITMNSTDIAAFMNRYGQEASNIHAPNHSGETTVGADGGVIAPFGATRH